MERNQMQQDMRADNVMDENIQEANEIIEDLDLADLNDEFVEELRESLVSFLSDGILLDAHSDRDDEVINVHLIHELGMYRVEYQIEDGAWFTHFIGRDMCAHAVNVWTTNAPEPDDVMVDGVAMSVTPSADGPDSAVITFSKGEARDGSVIDQYEFDLCEAYQVMKDFTDRVEELPDGSIRWKYGFVPVDGVNDADPSFVQ